MIFHPEKICDCGKELDLSDIDIFQEDFKCKCGKYYDLKWDYIKDEFGSEHLEVVEIK